MLQLFPLAWSCSLPYLVVHSYCCNRLDEVKLSVTRSLTVTSEVNAAFQIQLHENIGSFNICQVSQWWLIGCHSSSPWSCRDLNSCCVTLSQTTPLDKEKQVFRRRRNQDVKLSPHLPRSVGAGASRSANHGLSAAELTPESVDYSPGSAGTVRSISPF